MKIETLQEFEKLVAIMKEYKVDRVQLEGLEVIISVNLIPEDKPMTKDELIGWSA